VRERYDFILIDCPPSLNMLTLNALVAADSVLIPMQCEYYALEGLSALMETLRNIQDTVNSNLKLEGILRTMVDTRSRLTKDVSQQLFKFFDQKVYQTCIPRNIRLAEAPSHGLPVRLYDKASRGAIAYEKLAAEFLANEKSRDNE
ncbi:MAG: ParA family protein, partial [Methylococcales bacterium]|nr:ParA family protein [Methylococcales bacterium]